MSEINLNLPRISTADVTSALDSVVQVTTGVGGVVDAIAGLFGGGGKKTPAASVPAGTTYDEIVAGSGTYTTAATADYAPVAQTGAVRQALSLAVDLPIAGRMNLPAAAAAGVAAYSVRPLRRMKAWKKVALVLAASKLGGMIL